MLIKASVLKNVTMVSSRGFQFASTSSNFRVGVEG